MKKNFIQFSMRAAVLLTALLTICSATLFTACTNDSFDNPIYPTNLSDEIDYFEDVPGNEGDPAVVAALQSIENVEDLYVTDLPWQLLKKHATGLSLGASPLRAMNIKDSLIFFA